MANNLRCVVHKNRNCIRTRWCTFKILWAPKGESYCPHMGSRGVLQGRGQTLDLADLKDEQHLWGEVRLVRKGKRHGCLKLGVAEWHVRNKLCWQGGCRATWSQGVRALGNWIRFQMQGVLREASLHGVWTLWFAGTILKVELEFRMAGGQAQANGSGTWLSYRLKG